MQAIFTGSALIHRTVSGMLVPALLYAGGANSGYEGKEDPLRRKEGIGDRRAVMLDMAAGLTYNQWI